MDGWDIGTEEELKKLSQGSERELAMAGLVDALGGRKSIGHYWLGQNPQEVGATSMVKGIQSARRDPLADREKLTGLKERMDKLRASDEDRDPMSQKSVFAREMLAKSGIPVGENMSYAQLSDGFPFAKPQIEQMYTERNKKSEHANRLEQIEAENRGKQFTAAQAKKLSPTEVLKVDEGNALPKILEDVSHALDANQDLMGPVMGRLNSMNPYDTQSQGFQSKIKSASQAFGRYMEGGVLRKEDEVKYEKMFPQMGDTYAVAKEKLGNVENLLRMKQESAIGALDSQGYNVSGLEMPKMGDRTAQAKPHGGAPAKSATAAKNYDDMSDAELDALLKQKGLLK
jgi:hypothetical protein